MSQEDAVVIPYRCQQCCNLLERMPSPSAVLSNVGVRFYTCERCGHMMQAAQVESCAFDVETELPPVAELNGNGPHKLRDLLAYLRTTHNPDYVYRGQNSIWPGPLVPSLHRGTIAAEPTAVPPALRLREKGTVFHAVNTTMARTDENDLQRRAKFNSQLFQIFGYPFGSILAQQCGVSSEGLDVSHYPDVAALFAIFKFSTHSFMTQGTGVIYRIHVPADEYLNYDIRPANFFSCPTVLSAYVTFHQLKRVASWQDAMAAFHEYGFQMTFNPGPMRPLQLLALPTSEIPTCRVMQQQAALLLPDLVLPQSYNQTEIKPPPGKAEWDGPLLIEDLSKRDGVETFEFAHDVTNQYCVPKSPDVMFAKDDGVTRFLKVYFATNPRTLFFTEFGVFGEEDLELVQ